MNGFRWRCSARPAASASVCQLLAGHPWFRLAEVVASDARPGKRYCEATEWRLDADMPESARELVVKDYDDDLDSPVVFSALPGEVAARSSSGWREGARPPLEQPRPTAWTPTCRLMIPEVNPEHVAAIETADGAIGVGAGSSSPTRNCSAIHLVLALKPLHDAFGLDALAVTTMQAVSGAGYPGVPSLDMIDNVVPFISTEEEKMAEETRKLLGGFDGGFSPADSSSAPTATAFPCATATPSASRSAAAARDADEVIEAFERSAAGRRSWSCRALRSSR